MLAPSAKDQARVPTTGMRGGLGRTLLTAFLVLAIVPLSALSWYAVGREKQGIQREVTAKLSSVATVMEAQVRHWAEYRRASLVLMADLPVTRENVEALASAAANNSTARDTLLVQLQSLLSQDSSFRRLAVFNGAGVVLVSIDSRAGEMSSGEMDVTGQSVVLGQEAVAVDLSIPEELMVVQPVLGRGGETVGTLVGWFDMDGLIADLHLSGQFG